jgi:hypothetical protein
MRTTLDNTVVLNKFSVSSIRIAEDRNWVKFIEHLNSKHSAGFSGGCYGEYYGISNGRGYVNVDIPAGADVISLEEAIDIINLFTYHENGNSFFVARPSEPSTDWGQFIDALNEFCDTTFNGDQENAFYGLRNGGNMCLGTGGMRRTNITPISVEQGIRLLEFLTKQKEDMENTMVTTYNGEEHPASDCVVLDNESGNGGEYALKSECFYSRVHSGYILQSEAAQDARGSFFVEDNADDLDYVWSDHNDAWINTNWNDVHYGYTSYRNEDYFMDDDYAYINGNYYVNSNIANECGYYYDNDEDEWYHEDDDRPVNSDPYNITYHSNRGREYRAGDAKFTIGVEVEKEDDDACTLHWQDVLNDTGWVKEKDGSLERNGYELVSPVFNLFNDGMDKEIEASSDLQTLINAEFSEKCGGHINLGSTEYTPAQLFEGLSAFMPLLYTMYPNRVDIHYCQAKSKYKYRSVTSEYEAKYSAAYIKDKVVEFRIFPAVRSVKNLLWRRDLVRIMCDNINKSELDVLKMLVNQNSKLYKHLRKIYSQDVLLERTKQFITYTERFNDKKLPPIDPKKLKRGDDNIIDSTSFEDLGA